MHEGDHISISVSGILHGENLQIYFFFSADVQFPLNASQEPNNSGSPITDYTLEHDDG